MISITVGQLLSDVAEELEVVDSGGGPTTLEQASMIRRLQRLIDSSNIQRPLIFSERIDLLTLVANQQKYTIGIDPTGADTAAFAVPRPTKIERANLLISSTVRRPMAVWDFKQWARVRYQQVAGPPRGVYYDNGYGAVANSLSGLGTLSFYMIPDQAYQWEMYSWQQNTNVAVIADLLNYPPGYADYWLYSMVIRCASMFGRTPTAAHVELLRQAMEAIGAANSPSPEIGSDPALVGRDQGLYSWLDGQVE